MSKTIKVWPIDFSSSYLVRGTQDVEEARDAMLRYAMTSRWREDLGQFDEQEARLYRSQLEALRPEVGWFRCNPCYCGEEHLFDMATADGPGQGNFRGVYFA